MKLQKNMQKSKQNANRINRIKRFLCILFNSFPTGFIIGGIIGVLLSFVINKSGLFITGIVVGVILEQLLLGTKRLFMDWISTRPLNKLLGSIVTDQYPYIFFSSFYRDLTKPKEFRLFRTITSPREKPQEIVGPALVMGEGDATAISLIQGLLIKAGKKPDDIRLERAEKYMDQWGLSSIIIGLHNPKSRVLLSKSEKIPYKFDLNYRVITLREDKIDSIGESKVEYKKGVYIDQTPDSEPTDYAIISKIIDPFHPSKKTLIILAGLGPAGTAGAAYYLVTNYKEISQKTDNFTLLIQVPSGYQSAREVNFDKVADYYQPQR